jgi:uncharacterized protein (TIGR04255 family)
MATDKALLNVPKVKSVRYERNFITTAVCEFRFPTLLELETSPPTDFQKKIRKDYPFYEPQIIEMGGSERLTREARYLFRSKDQNWTVSLRSFSLSLETSRYLDFEDFFTRLKILLDTSKEYIDTDFFTRVGLRYLNAIPITDNQLEGWICPDLVASLTKGVYGSAEKYSGTIQGYTELGQYSFRHGTKHVELREEKNQSMYILDFDYFSENIEIKNVLNTIKGFNEINFSFFNWCLGEKAKAYLGAGVPKSKPGAKVI